MVYATMSGAFAGSVYWVHGNVSSALKTCTGVSILSAWILSFWTAESRHVWAERQFRWLKAQLLFNVQMNESNINEILQDSGCEYKKLPLVAAFFELRSYDKILRNIETNLVQAIDDVGKQTELGRKLDDLVKRAAHDLSRVRANEAFIKSHDKMAWFEQWKIYQRQKIERERIRQYYGRPQIHSHVVYHWR